VSSQFWSLDTEELDVRFRSRFRFQGLEIFVCYTQLSEKKQSEVNIMYIKANEIASSCAECDHIKMLIWTQKYQLRSLANEEKHSHRTGWYSCHRGSSLQWHDLHSSVTTDTTRIYTTLRILHEGFTDFVTSTFFYLSLKLHTSKYITNRCYGHFCRSEELWSVSPKTKLPTRPLGSNL